MRRLQTVVITGTLAVATLVVGCAGQKPQQGGPLARTDMPIQEVKDLPKWVTEKGAAFSGERRVLYGVGNSAGIYNPALRRKAAEGQSRNDLAATLQVYVAGLQKQYMAETTAGSMDKSSVEQHIQDTFKQVTEATLVGAQVVQYWENPLRNRSLCLGTARHRTIYGHHEKLCCGQRTVQRIGCQLARVCEEECRQGARRAEPGVGAKKTRRKLTGAVEKDGDRSRVLRALVEEAFPFGPAACRHHAEEGVSLFFPTGRITDLNSADHDTPAC